MKKRSRTVVLIGNPNTGKSTLFGALSGFRQHVGNYPGVTVDHTIGRMRAAGQDWVLVDLPGTYSLAPRSLDEMVAVDVLLGRRAGVPAPDVVLCVISADNLERNAYLLGQVLELGVPTVVAVTMLDVAAARGLTIDLDALRTHLGGVPIVGVRAKKREGLEDLVTALADTCDRPPSSPASPLPESFHAEVRHLEPVLKQPAGPDETSSRSEADWPYPLVARLLLDTGGYLEQHLPQNDAGATARAELQASRDRLAASGCAVPEIETISRYRWVAGIVQDVIERADTPRRTWGDAIDAVLTHPLVGTIFLTILMLLVFSAVFSWARAPMAVIEAGVAAVSEWAGTVLPAGPIRGLMVEGVIGGIGAVLVFLPQIFTLFFFLAALEECGYLARAAYLMDRHMVHVGLSGKSFIPLLSSFACAIPGVMATRVIEDRRDRLTTILIAPLMSCSARLPIYTLMITGFVPERHYLGNWLNLQGLTLFAMYALGIVVAAAVAWVLERTLLRGPVAPFVLELPAYQWPSPRVILFRMLERGWDFVRAAGTVICAVSIVMWAALAYPRASEQTLGPWPTELRRLESEIGRARANGDEPVLVHLEDQHRIARGHIDSIQKRQSWLGRAGRWIEPAVRPLGWDWRIGSAVIASFPAREVVVASLGVIFDAGVDAKNETGKQRLRETLAAATWPDTGQRLFTTPVALSIIVFFALCAQCASTLAVIGRETRSWGWSLFTFGYLTTLAYAGAFMTYQVGKFLVG